ncbi:hypothetical protein JCM11641_007779 [Rhodosporidiobolus odoratus]
MSTLTPTPSPDDDQKISAVLQRAKALHASLEPLYTWDELCELIGSCQLAVLSRQPEFEELYAKEFGLLVRSKYGTMERYLRKQLGWQGNEEGDYWVRTGKTDVRRNDWPYGIPKDVSHWVVWVPLPLFHPSLCAPSPSRASTPLPPHLLQQASSSNGTSTPSGVAPQNPLAHDLVMPTKGTWDWVSKNGLSGLTGQAEERWREKRKRERAFTLENGAEDDNMWVESAEAEAQTDVGVEVQEEGPEREIEGFVKGRWKVEDGWETAWFANPPALQSVPGLAHFHVLARRNGGKAHEMRVDSPQRA